MPSCTLMKLFFVTLLIGCVYTVCPSNWTVLGYDCCSPTFGFNSTIPTFHLSHGRQYPDVLTVWNDSSHTSLAIDTNWITLNVLWGKLTGDRSEPYAPSEIINAVGIFYQSGKGLYGLQFHTATDSSPVYGLATGTTVHLNNSGLPFTGWGVITHQQELLQSLSVCFGTEKEKKVKTLSL